MPSSKRRLRNHIGLKDEELRPLLAQAPALIWTTDRELRITYVAGSPVANIRPEVSQAVSDQAGPDDSTERHVAEHLRAIQGESVQYDIEHEDQLARVRLHPLRDADAEIIGVVGLAVDITDCRNTEARILHLATHDPHTDLANYTSLIEAFDRELRRCARTNRPFAVLLFDIDQLKTINDTHGHLVGSRCLLRLAEILKRTCRSIDTAARYGGDEFAVLLVETDEAIAARVARRIADRLTEQETEPPITASFGFAVCPTDGDTIETLLTAADRRLYKNKLRSALHRKGNCRCNGSCTSTSIRPESHSEPGQERRRSTRFAADINLSVRGESIDKRSFQEDTFTLSVNAHGVLLVLETQVTLGQTVFLKTRKTGEEKEARVVRFGSTYGGVAQVGIEFVRPDPVFCQDIQILTS